MLLKLTCSCRQQTRLRTQPPRPMDLRLVKWSVPVPTSCGPSPALKMERSLQLISGFLCVCS